MTNDYGFMSNFGHISASKFSVAPSFVLFTHTVFRVFDWVVFCYFFRPPCFYCVLMTSYPEQRKPAVKKDLSQERLLLQGRRLMTRHVLNTPYTNFGPYASAFSMTFQAYTKLVSVKISRLTCRKPDLSIERFTGLVYVCFQHFRLGVALYLACCNVKN